MGPYLAVAACCGGQDVVGVLGAGSCVELALCGCVFVGFLGMELSCGVCPCMEGDSWHLGLGACVKYLCSGWEWPVGEFMLGFMGGGGAYGVKIRILWGAETVSSWDGSGWWVRLDQVDPSFVRGPLCRLETEVVGGRVYDVHCGVSLRWVCECFYV
ncbi:hypothetical protein XENORESO_006774 [Xenotaenia resolanae]|uniref:C-type lectin domain-containing protein n=1 Tax=Xenotaenia resolanae TaxID=208358 RepID=A0ABV0W303_9TELE